SSNQLAVPQALKRLNAIATQLPKLADKVYAQSNDFDFQKHPVATRIVELINSRCTMTLRRLSR
ncbi:hypothetical protein N9850_11595, partial [Granulosicoccus sp.]